MASLTPQQVAEKWKRNTGAAVDAYKQGIQSVQTAPGELAARAADRMLQRITDSVTSGRYQAAARATTLTDWQQASVNKGAPRLAQGAAAAQPKVVQFMTEFLPVMEQVKQTVRTMPKGTTEDALARIRVNIEAGKRFAGRS